MNLFYVVIALGLVKALPTHKKYLQPQSKSSSKISPLRLSSSNTPTVSDYQASFKQVNNIYQILAAAPAGLPVSEILRQNGDPFLSRSEVEQILAGHKQWFTEIKSAETCLWKANLT